MISLLAAAPAAAQTTVTVAKTDGLTSAVPGQDTVTYTIVVGASGETGDTVSVVDNFPAGLICTYSSVATNATGNTSGAGNISDTLNMGNPSSVTYAASCSITSSATGTLSNTADATPMGSLSTAGSDTDNDTVLLPEADLAVTKTDGVTSATPGGSADLHYRRHPTPVPATITSATLTDTFPADLSCSYTSAAGRRRDRQHSRWVRAKPLAETLSLPAGSSVTYTVNCTIDASGYRYPLQHRHGQRLRSPTPAAG